VETFKERRQFFELIPLNESAENNKIVKVRRALIGSSETCDVILNYSDINPIHAILEVKKDGLYLYDMNSKTGSYVNGEKIVKSSFNVGDKLKFGNHEFAFNKYKKKELPPVLDIIDPLVPPILHEKAPEIPEATIISDSKKTKIEYPLASDPNAQYSEYIFEDTEELLPIFKYHIDKQAVEVVILYSGKIYSVDYLPKKNGLYYFTGKDPSENEVEFVHLGVKEKIEFLKIENNNVIAYHFEGYEVSYLADNEISTSNQYPINDDDILILKKNDIEIFIRRTDQPPKVARAPILSKDRDLNKYLLIIYIAVAIFLSFLFAVDVDKEKEKEKDPERIASILYKPKKIAPQAKAPKVEKVKKEVKPKPPKEPVKKAPEKVVKKIAPTPPKKVVKVKPPKLAKPNKGPQTVKIKKVSPQVKKVSKPAGPKKVVKVSAPKAAVVKSLGKVDAYKSIDFKSTLNRLAAKGGVAPSIKKIAVGGSAGEISSVTAVSAGATITTAKVTTNVGSLSGVVSGKIDTSAGVKGIVDKKTIYTAGIPDKTVVLGSMDPDIIRKILREHLPQFRHCYQKVLDRSSSTFSGVVDMNFTIGASGNVAKAGVSTTSGSIPANVRGCVVNVLRGIQFPAPLGGGEVEVNQPFNFYPVNK
jgi:pSer/pThr/pTyr-binding forkhead associated (FHA) protein/outer membrane biosynthesis protein TonB